MEKQVEKKTFEFELSGVNYLLCQVVIWMLNLVLIFNLFFL